MIDLIKSKLLARWMCLIIVVSFIHLFFPSVCDRCLGMAAAAAVSVTGVGGGQFPLTAFNYRPSASVTTLTNSAMAASLHHPLHVHLQQCPSSNMALPFFTQLQIQADARSVGGTTSKLPANMTKTK